VSVPLSILDLAPIAAGATAADALAGTTAVARRADALGYRRFWVAEHHNIPAVASTAPEVLIAHVAANTERIRVGSGGVMLPNHAPLAVAERFGMLEALHPNRIDLGLGRAPGTDMRTALALRSTSPDQFPEQLAALRGHLGDGHQGMRAVAGEHSQPQIWMLGSTDGGARIAAEHGLPFVFAHHFHPQLTEPALALYRDGFQATAELGQPRTIVAAAVVVGADDGEAIRLALPGAISMLRLRQGRPEPLLGVAEAEDVLGRLGPTELAVVENALGRVIHGSPAAVESALVELIERTAPDELMLTSNVADPEQRIRTFEQVAAALAGSPA
jgi:luciferase family oxidoreductase group 1